MARGDKGQATREALLEAALRLFAEQGYRATPMHQIAAAAGRSPGLTYRYFSRKEDFGLALYQRIVDETAELVVEGATPGQRFASWMHGKLTVLQPHRAVLGALASAAVDPEDPLGVLSDETADLRRAVVAQLARVADPDGDADPLWVQGVYGLHMLLVLLFVQDRSDDLRATRAATDLVAQVLDLVPPGSPMATLALARVRPVLELLAVDDGGRRSEVG
jgi:AcrR family transcriptional regulator